MEILDCTLRDGGYYTNWDFDSSLVDDYLAYIDKLPIDFVELGYRSKPMSKYYGEFFYCPKDTLKIIREKSQKRIVIMLNEKDVDLETADKLLRPIIDLVDLVRIAVDPNRFDNSLKLAKFLKSIGLKVGFNIMYMSTWKDRKGFLEKLVEVNGVIEYLYMVDSYGGVYPDDVKDIYSMVKSKTNVKIGFHGHNNLELGLINTLTAIQCGVDIIDCTVTGMGRGAGNLSTELLLTALKSKNKVNFDFNDLSAMVSLFDKLKEHYRWGTNLPYMVSGANSLPQKKVMEWVGKRFYSINSIIRALNNDSKGIKDNIQLENLEVKEPALEILIIGGGPTATDHSKAVLLYLTENPEVVVIHVSSKNSRAYAKVKNTQIHCLAGNEGIRLEKIFKELDNENRLAILPPFPRYMGTYIPSYFKTNSFQLKDVNFAIGYENSITAIAIQTALEFNALKINFIGYDGYENDMSQNELELFQENEQLFSILNNLDLEVNSLTSTKYDQLIENSIYSMIS